MNKWIFILSLLVWTCGPKPEPKPELKPIIPMIEQDPGDNTALDKGYMNAFDVYTFLKKLPSEEEIIYTFGIPDSTWIDEQAHVKIWYYYIEEIRDYNSIELDPITGKVLGFEWD